MPNQFFKPANYHSISSIDPRDFTEHTLYDSEPNDDLWRAELHDWFDTVFCREGRVEVKHGDD